MSFDYTQEEITRLAKENNFTVAGIEKVMRLSNILNDLNNQPEFSGKLLLKGGTAINLLVFIFPGFLSIWILISLKTYLKRIC